VVDSWEIIIAPETAKRLARIPNPERRRILTAIDALHSGLSGDIKPMKGREEWRLRIGDWRVLLDIKKEKKTIYVLSVGSRGDVYK
jgi:mRNA interferase RelE/StbE